MFYEILTSIRTKTIVWLRHLQLYYAYNKTIMINHTIIFRNKTPTIIKVSTYVLVTDIN